MYDHTSVKEMGVNMRRCAAFMTVASPRHCKLRSGADALRECVNTNLFLLPESKKTNARHLHNFEAHTRNITLGFPTATETRNENFVVLINKVQATIILTFSVKCIKSVRHEEYRGYSRARRQ